MTSHYNGRSVSGYAESLSRDKMLGGVAEAARRLLSVVDFDVDFDDAVSGALEAIATASGIDRIYVFENQVDPQTGEERAACPYEWTAPGCIQVREVPDHFPMSYRGFEQWLEGFKQGQTTQSLACDLPGPAQAIQEMDQTLSLLVVPIMVEGQYWGVIGFDDCTTERIWSNAEIAVLETAAACVGSAIERGRAHQAREATARARAVELEAHNRVLAGRDRILQATAEAASSLLTGADFDAAIDRALAAIGSSLNTDRVTVIENVHPSDAASPRWKMLYEWTAPQAVCQMIVLAEGSYEGIETWHDAINAGESISCRLEDMPEPFRSEQAKIGVKVLHAVPVFVEGRCWGVVGIDDCREETQRSDAELSILKTAAACIGGAIKQERSRRGIQQAEREALIAQERAARAAELEAANRVLTTRDRWLETTAVAVSQLLSSDDVEASVNAALQTLGENLDCDRLGIMRHLPESDDSESAGLGHFQLLHEWDAAGTTNQMAQDDLVIVPASDFADWTAQLMAGSPVGSLTAEQDEPFRSKLQALNILSAYAVPIFIGSTFWGLMFMDCCREARQLLPAEVAVFNTAAACVGSAIYQGQVRRDRVAQERAYLLGSVAEVANLLLRSADCTSVFSEVTRLLGEAVGSDRCSITQDVIHQPSGRQAVKVLDEWTRQNIAPTFESAPDYFDEGVIVVQGSFLGFHQTLSRGEVVNFFVADITPNERAFMAAQGNTSMLLVPIMVRGECWGEIGFDNCGPPRLYDEAEIATLQIAAESIAAAIARQAQDEAIRDSEERYRNLIELSSEGIYRLELDEPISRSLPVDEQVALVYQRCYVAEANTAMATMYGCPSPEAMLGWQLSELHIEASAQNTGFLSEWLASTDCCISNSESEELDVAGSVHYFLNNVIGIVEDGHLVRVWGTQTDVTEFKQIQAAREAAERSALLEQQRAEALAERDRILTVTATAARALLSGERLNESIDRALRIIGEGTGSDRVIVMEHHGDASGRSLGYAQMLFEWHSPRAVSQLYHPDLQRVSYDGIEDWYQQLCQGFVVGGLVAEFPEPLRSGQQEIGVKSTYAVPILTEGRYWGLIAFDDCHEAKRRSEAEIAVLKTAAACIGSAIQQSRTRRAQEEARQAALLEQQRSAELGKLNEAIGQTLNTLTATPELDEFLGHILIKTAGQVNACKAHLFFYDEEKETLKLHLAVEDGQVYHDCPPGAPESFRHDVPANTTGFWAAVVDSPRPFVTDEQHPQMIRHYWPDSIPWHQAEGHLSTACACMRVAQRPIGFIGFAFRHTASLTHEQLEFIQALTNQATLAVHLTRLAQEAKQTAVLQEREAAARQRAAELAKVNEAIGLSLTSLAASPELDQFLGCILAEMAEQLGACKVHLFLYDSATHTLNQRVAVQDGTAYVGASPIDPEMFRHPIPADHNQGWSSIINSSRPLIYDENSPYEENDWWPESLDWHKAQGHKAITCIPMKAGPQPIGFIGFCFYDRTVLTDGQLEFMQALANQAIVAIQLTRLAEEARQTAILQEQEKASRQRAAELAKINEAVSQTLNALTTEPELDQFLGKILTQIVEQIDADDTHLFLYDEETHTLRSHIAVQDGQVYLGTAPGDPEIFHHPFPVDLTPAWQILIDSSKPITLDKNNLESVRLCWPETLSWHKSMGHRSATCTSMKVGAKPIGLVGFAFCDRAALTDEQLEFIQALTNQATLSIHLTRLAEQSQSAALTAERNRLAREIHDTLAQSFTGVSLQLEAVRGIISRAACSPETVLDTLTQAQTYIRNARDLARQGLSEARRSVLALRSEALEADELPEALRKILANTDQNTDLQAYFYLEGEPRSLSEDVQLNLLRIAQEAITNALRHAQAAQLDLTLSFTADQVQLHIVDDGAGFDAAALGEDSGFGLIGIRERVARFYGEFELQSTPGIGTTLSIVIPLR